MYLLVQKGIELYNVSLQDTESYKQMIGWRIPGGHWVNDVYCLSWVAYHHLDHKPIFNFGEE